MTGERARRRGPVIGIVGHDYAVPRPFGVLPVHGTPRSYAAGVRASGGRAVILPPGGPSDLLDLVDGLVLTGGGDLDPARYGGAGPARDVVPARDEDEIALVHAALSARVPLLGSCRGMQVLAVACGGRLADVAGHIDPDAGHPVTTATGSVARDLIGERSLTSALHHQAVIDPGPAWTATAWSDDGTVEALEPADGLPALGVQWHPELCWNQAPLDRTGPAIFGWLIDAAADRSTRRRTAFQ